MIVFLVAKTCNYLKNQSSRPAWILPVIIFSQFAGTSLWFAGNAVIEDLQKAFSLGDGAIEDLTSAVQLGFIFGTLVFAILSLADRYSPSKVFFYSAILGGLANLGVFFLASGLTGLMLFRFLTGFFLAGIYPVGMKISADWYEKGLGNALGLLVGALVIGTSFPHLLKNITNNLPWEILIFATSGLAAFGGVLIYLFVPDGPYRKPMSNFALKSVFRVFKNKAFRSAAFGYFGHMWELYSFWAFIPLILTIYQKHNQDTVFDVSLWSFLIIAIGGAGCAMGGKLSLSTSSSKIAFYALLTSGVSCLLSPFMFYLESLWFLAFLLIWGLAVVTDSPQFSTLVAQTAPPKMKGTALTIVNSIGFAITIVSLQFVKQIGPWFHERTVFIWLAIGPVIGCLSILPLLKKDQN